MKRVIEKIKLAGVITSVIALVFLLVAIFTGIDTGMHQEGHYFSSASPVLVVFCTIIFLFFLWPVLTSYPFVSAKVISPEFLHYFGPNNLGGADFEFVKTKGEWYNKKYPQEVIDIIFLFQGEEYVLKEVMRENLIVILAKDGERKIFSMELVPTPDRNGLYHMVFY